MLHLLVSSSQVLIQIVNWGMHFSEIIIFQVGRGLLSGAATRVTVTEFLVVSFFKETVVATL